MLMPAQKCLHGLSGYECLVEFFEDLVDEIIPLMFDILDFLLFLFYVLVIFQHFKERIRAVSTFAIRSQAC